MSEFKDNESVSDNEEAVAETFEDDWEEQDETLNVQSLFSSTVFNSVESLIAHEMQEYNFDIKKLVSDLKCDDQSIIMMINFIRSKVLLAKEIDSLFISSLCEELEKKDYLSDEANMKPVLAEDALLFLLHDTLNDEEAEEGDRPDEWHQDSEQIESNRLKLRETLPNYSVITQSLE